MSRTGHGSIAARIYKRASSTIVRAGSDALQPPIGEPEYKILKVDKKGKEETANESSATTSLVNKDGAYYFKGIFARFIEYARKADPNSCY